MDSVLSALLSTPFGSSISSAFNFIVSGIVDVVLGTRDGYPWFIVITHCIHAIASFRHERDQRGGGCHWTASLGLSFMCYGFGGTVLSDLAMGYPVTAASHSRILQGWLLGWLLVWFSPGDLVFREWRPDGSFNIFRLVIVFGECLDACMTPVGRVTRAARTLVGKKCAPIAAGVLAGTGGAVVRYVERVHLAKPKKDDVETARKVAQGSLNDIEAAVWRNLGYCALFWWAAVYAPQQRGEGEEAYGGPDELRLTLLLFHAGWGIAAELGLPQRLLGSAKHPFVHLAHGLLTRGPIPSIIRKALRLGPQSLPEGWDNNAAVQAKQLSAPQRRKSKFL